MPSYETEMLGDLIEWLQDHPSKEAEAFAENLIPWRADLERRDAVEEAAYARGLEQGEARAWNAMRNFVAMRGDDTRLTSADLTDRLVDKLLSVSGDLDSAKENVERLSYVLLQRVTEKFR